MAISYKLAPFPTHAEIIHELSLALGTNKTVASKLKALVDPNKASSITNPIDLKSLLSDALTVPLKRVLGIHAQAVTDVVIAYFRDYSELVAQENADGLTRHDLLRLLAVNFLPEFWNEILYQLAARFELPANLINEMCQLNISSLQVASEWISVEYPGGSESWMQRARASLSYDDSTAGLFKYHLRPYDNHVAQSLPMPETILRLFTVEFASTDEQRFLVVLLIARLLDYVKRTNILKISIPLATSRVILDDTIPIFKRFRECLLDERRANIIARAQLERIYEKLDNAVSLDTVKDASSPQKVLDLIHQAQTLHSNTYSLQNPVADKSYYYLARYNVLSGDLNSAAKQYSEALDRALYTDGILTQAIINEGYLISARIDNRVLLKRLRRAANILILDGNGSPEASSFSNRFNDHIADWEVEHWACEYQNTFKREFMFSGYSVTETTIEPWFLKNSKQAHRKVDVRSPNAKRTSGIGITNKTPQILLSMENQDDDGFTKLLNKKVDIDVADSFGTTPLIYALHLLNPLTKENPKISYFDYLVKLPHSLETLSSYSSMYETTALACAIETGKSRYLEGVLSLADQALKGEHNEFSKYDFVNQKCPEYYPLTRLVRLIIGVNNPNQLNRYQKPSIELFELSQLYEMARILIAHKGTSGQSVGLELSPYWLAIKFDEVELLRLLLTSDADPATPFHDLNNAKTYTTLEFCHQYKSEKCIRFLEAMTK